jgi:hypothetical protein
MRAVGVRWHRLCRSSGLQAEFYEWSLIKSHLSIANKERRGNQGEQTVAVQSPRCMRELEDAAAVKYIATEEQLTTAA